MDTTDFNFTHEVQVGYAAVECWKTPINITFTPYNAKKYTNVVGYLRFENCITSLDDLKNFAMAVTLRVTIHQQTLLLGSLDKRNISNYQDLRNLTAIWFENYQNPAPYFADILSFTNTFLEVGEVIFKNMSWENLPEFFERKFPNLQTLDIPHNKFTVPPVFPWTEQMLTLPENFSRTGYFKDQYLKAFYLDIPPNIYKRYLNLNFNQIQDLRTDQWQQSNECEARRNVCLKKTLQGVQNNALVVKDCRLRKLYELHHLMPKGELELWYRGNAITSLMDRGYLAFVAILDLRENKLNHIDPNAVGRFLHIKDLRLDSNLLDSLPKEVMKIEWVHLTLQNNPYKCDCTTLCMKEWIIKNKYSIYDWEDIKCNNKDNGGLEFVFVPDEEFVCDNSESQFDSIRNVVISSVSTAITMDALIVHSGMLTDWVMQNIVDVLKGRDYNFRICDMARDFVIGFSFQENLTQIVRHSKRMLLLVSEDWKTGDEKLKVTWNIAQEKIKESKSNYVIIISHGIKPQQIKDKTLFIDSGNRLFVEKVLYSMPIKTDNKHGQWRRKPNAKTFIQREFSIKEDHVDDNRIHVFISYSDQDLHFVTKKLAPELERRGYRLCLPDRDFIPGASKEENILKAIDVSLRTVFVLSGPLIKDEWSLFTFRSACEKSLRKKTKHLIVIVRDDGDLNTIDEEVKHYLKTYVSLHVEDRWFWSKLLNRLPPTDQKCRSGFTSPLSLSQCTASDAVTIEMMEVLLRSEKRVVTRF
ncbi:hypothetical protein CHS0354_014264 [Potamilus streckersoni]|uniref:TIR domain-containing protein n=1 Tax=Potamilus streckersoni TaxID=2493646 RepID=A0AAE0TBR7_9BIVA|nr:hypothetical protein CHS0354_014264 [Potamilus streckersoni]